MHTNKSFQGSSPVKTGPSIFSESSETVDLQSKKGLQTWLAVALAIGLTTAVYGVRQYLRQPLPSLSTSEQLTLLNKTEFTGTISPTKEFKLAAPTPAIVHQILVKEGEQVSQNQPLLVLENLDFQQSYGQAKQQQQFAKQQVQQLQTQIASLRQLAELNAQMADAEESLSTAQMQSQQVPLPQRQDSIARAQATYDLASAQFARMQSLHGAGALSKAELDRYQADLRVAAADLQSAKQAKAAAQKVLDEQATQVVIHQELTKAQQNQQLVEMQGQLAAAQLQYEQWTDRLEQLEQQWGGDLKQDSEVGRMVIRATEAGVITSLPVAVGDQIFSGTTLVDLAQLDILHAVVPVDARLINTLEVNQRALVELGMGAEVQSFDAKVLSIQPIPNEDLTHQVKIEFNNPNNFLLVRQPAKVHFISD